jgi:regulator of protease activity HflC (stomatin/prohibitin superfamily)
MLIICTIATGFIFSTMATLEPLEYGIQYNVVTKSIGEKIYTSGRYFINPFTKFFRYPANLITVEFSDSPRAKAPGLQTRTAEGLNLLLHVSFQYYLLPEGLTKLYNLANVNYHGTVVRIARDVILKVAGNYNSTSYWTERKKIGDYMKMQLNQELQSIYCNCSELQLIRIDLPQIFEDSIVDTQVEVQKANMRKFQQYAELIRQNISIIRSQAEQAIKIIKTSGEAEGYKIKQTAKAKALNQTINMENEVYKKVRLELGLSGKEFSEYIFLNSLADKKDLKILVGLNNSIINFPSNPITASQSIPTTNSAPGSSPIINTPVPAY